MNIDAKVSAALAKMDAVMPRAGAGFDDNKLMLFGDPGSGKTSFLTDLVDTFDEKLLVISTEQGGGGLITVANELEARGKIEKFHSNVFSIDLADYRQVLEIFLLDPDPDTGKKIPRLYRFYPELREFRPTVLVWEGLTNFQQALVNLELLGEKEMEMEEKERWAYWGTMKTTTFRIHHDFLSCTDPDYQWHHILTIHETEDAERDGKGKVTKVLGVKPEIQGGGTRAIYQAYNLIVRTVKRRIDVPLKGIETSYEYITKAKATEEWEKCRGYELPPSFPADSARVWNELNRVRDLMQKEKK